MNAWHDEQTADVVNELRRSIRPSTVKAVLSNGETRELAVGVDANKWSKIGKLIDGLEWARLECFDAKGVMLGTIDHAIPEAAVEVATDPVAQQLNQILPFLRAIAAEVRGSHGEFIKTISDAHEIAVARGAELAVTVGELQAQLNEAYGKIRELMMEVHQGDPSGQWQPKDVAFLQGMNALATRFGLPAVTIPGINAPALNQLPPAQAAGNGGKA